MNRAKELALCALCLAPSVARAEPADAELAREARLPMILRVALARNPELAESRLRASAASAGARAAARLPEPELKYEQWGVPLERPYALGTADTLMIGLRQALPAWGTREARARMAAAEAAGVGAGERARRVALVAEVRRAYAEYARAHREIALHRQHVGLTERLLELSRLNYQSGRTTQQDVLRLGLELSRLHADIARIDQERRSSAALLNALMNRAPAAPLGPPPEAAPPGAPEAGSIDARPDLQAAAESVRRSEAATALARQAALWPTVMLGLDYMYMPESHSPHGYGAMVSLGLPWLSGQRRDEREQAETTLRADERALEAARASARYEVADASARLAAAREGLAIVDTNLLPQARRTMEATQAAFSVGQGDAVGLLDSLRSYLQVQVERVRALARIESAAADLDRATGREVTP
jgi:cobalt-zinc-cadmium efflux system outer membrane protein